MKKSSIADKKLQKTLSSPQFQQNWASHMKAFGPIVKDAFAEDPQGRVHLCGALTHITAKNQPQALLKLNSLQKHLNTDADKAAFFFAMGLFCEYAGKYDEMAALYNQANDLHHRFYLPYLKAGKYALDTRDYSTAEKNYRAAVGCLSPADDKQKQLLASAHTNLASCLIMMHRYPEAEKALDASRALVPMLPGRAAPEAILHALRRETAELLSSLNTLKTMAPFAHDSIKKSTDRILSGMEPQFFTLPVEEEAVTGFWVWFCENEDGLTEQLEGQKYDAVMTAVGDRLLEAFPFLEERPPVTIGKNDRGFVIQLKDLYARGIAEAYRRLLEGCPEGVSSRWFFDTVH